jgi:phage terminase large subunit-like protein
MNRETKIALIQIKEEQARRKKYNAIKQYYPDTGPLRRELYQKHLQFFRFGLTKEERLALAANRVGKTEGMGGYEFTLHLTGDYPGWWEGRRFAKPIDTWAAGDTSQTVKDIIQLKLLGKIADPDSLGSGLIPKDAIVKYTRKVGHVDAVETIYVRHKSGGISECTLKSYDQKRHSFQGTKKQVIWLDEEPPLDIYTECLLRTTDTTGGSDNGIMMLTFTPLLGMSETVMAFLPAGVAIDDPSSAKAVVMATWDDVPHLSQAAKDKLWASIPPFQRDARSKGVPQLGAGAIYPVPESDFVVTDFEIPAHWVRVYGMDVGWNRTAVPWLAWDRDNDVVYITAEYYRGQAEPSIHAAAIKQKGDWIPGVIDPASRGRNQKDGQQLLQDYVDLGLDLDVAFNGVESGILEVWERLSQGRLKVFRSCQNWLYEFRLYRRDEKGRIVKENDHLMDGTRYAIMSGLERAILKPAPQEVEHRDYDLGSPGTGWMS